MTDQAQAQVNHSVEESNDSLEHFVDTGNLLQETVSKQSSELLSDDKDTRHTPFIRTRAYNLRSREAWLYFLCMVTKLVLSLQYCFVVLYLYLFFFLSVCIRLPVKPHCNLLFNIT